MNRQPNKQSEDAEIDEIHFDFFADSVIYSIQYFPHPHLRNRSVGLKQLQGRIYEFVSHIRINEYFNNFVIPYIVLQCTFTTARGR